MPIKQHSSKHSSSIRVGFRFHRTKVNEVAVETVVVVGQSINEGILRTMLVRTLRSVVMASHNLLHPIKRVMVAHHVVVD